MLQVYPLYLKDRRKNKLGIGIGNKVGIRND